MRMQSQGIKGAFGTCVAKEMALYHLYQRLYGHAN